MAPLFAFLLLLLAVVDAPPLLAKLAAPGSIEDALLVSEGLPDSAERSGRLEPEAAALLASRKRRHSASSRPRS